MAPSNTQIFLAQDALSGQHYVCPTCRLKPVASLRLQRSKIQIPAASGAQAQEVKAGLRSAFTRPFLHPDASQLRRGGNGGGAAKSAARTTPPPSAPKDVPIPAAAAASKRARAPRAAAVGAMQAVQQSIRHQEAEAADQEPYPKRQRVTASRFKASDVEASCMTSQQAGMHGVYVTPNVVGAAGGRAASRTPMTSTPGGVAWAADTVEVPAMHTGRRQKSINTARRTATGAEHALGSDHPIASLSTHVAACMAPRVTHERARAANLLDIARVHSARGGSLLAAAAAGEEEGALNDVLRNAWHTASARRAAIAKAPAETGVVLHKPTPVRARPRGAAAAAVPRSSGMMAAGAIASMRRPPRQIRDDPATEQCLGCSKCRFSAVGCRHCRSNVSQSQQRSSKARKPRGSSNNIAAIAEASHALAMPAGALPFMMPVSHQGTPMFVTPCFVPFDVSPFYGWDAVHSMDGFHCDELLIAAPGAAHWRDQSSPSMGNLHVTGAGGMPYLFAPFSTPGRGGAGMYSPTGAFLGSPGLLMRSPLRTGFTPTAGAGSPLGSAGRRLFSGDGRSAFMATPPRQGGSAFTSTAWGVDVAPPSPGSQAKAHARGH